MGILKKKKEKIEKLINYNGNDGCMATNMITIEGWKVRYLYKDEPSTVFQIVGGYFVIIHKLDNAGYSVIPMLFTLIFSILYRNSKKNKE